MINRLRKVSSQLASSGLFRLPLFCGLVAFSALLFTGIGWLMWIEFFLSDSLYYREKRAPSGQIVLVQSDETAVAATGRYPFDRGMLAKALVNMDKAGAKRFYLDTLLTHSANREEDDALESARQAWARTSRSDPGAKSDGRWPDNQVHYAASSLRSACCECHSELCL